jgi:hypothetical protein
MPEKIEERLDDHFREPAPHPLDPFDDRLRFDPKQNQDHNPENYAHDQEEAD